MAGTVKNQSSLKAWEALESHYKKLSKLHLRGLF